MKAILINRVELLEIVKANRDKHVADFEEATKDYAALVLRLCTANVEIAYTQDVTKFTNIKPIPPAPVSYEKEYARAIRMIELSVEENISVEQDVFNQLVMDEWSWKRGFAAAATLYKTM